MLAVGAPAPDFTLPSATGDDVSLADYRGEQPVLLFFHMAAG
ncbi:MAG: redoxin domain-containing protein [Chloroflexi bacterium]|nr:redoxin domain-containing protein [Chloroflexota bacterium]